MKWRNYQGGRRWAVLDDGRIAAEDKPPSNTNLIATTCDWGWVYRTRGKPKSMKQLALDYGPILEEASEEFEVRMMYIMALIAIEANRLHGDRLRFDPRSVREEPGYLSDARTPNKVSPGLMQTLISTANGTNEKYGMFPDNLDRGFDREDLFVPRYSILIGTAYVRTQIDRYEEDERANSIPPDDPVTNMVAAYNAGSVRPTTRNPWGMVTYSPTRIDRFIAWTNDAHEVLFGGSI